MKAPAALLAAVLLSACVTPEEVMPPFALVDQSGAAVRSEDFRGHALVVSFVFTACVEACPLITAQLARTQARARAERLDGRVRFVSITLDPAADTPEVLRRYADAHAIDGATWHFLTGSPGDVAPVIRAFGLTAPAGGRSVHGSLVLLVDGRGRIVERRTDLELDPDRLLTSLRKLLS